MKISKFVTDQEFAKKALKICLIVFAVSLLIPVIVCGINYGWLSDPDYEPTGEGRFMAIDVLVGSIADFPVLAAVISACIIIKLIDYRMTFQNKSSRTFNILGLAALPLWTAFAAAVFLLMSYLVAGALATLITDVIFASLSLKYYIVENVCLCIFIPILCVIPTLCILVYSIVSDVAGLKTTAALKTAPADLQQE